MDKPFAEIDCCKCGVVFWVPARLNAARRKDGGTFYCPNGHAQHYTETDADRFRRERDRLQQKISEMQDRADKKDRQVAAYRGQITKLKNRASKGVCPCCNRSFQNLRRHMESQHPDFEKEPLS